MTCQPVRKDNNTTAAIAAGTALTVPRQVHREEACDGKRIGTLRVILRQIDRRQKLLTCVCQRGCERDVDHAVTVRYDVPWVNGSFRDSVERFAEGVKLNLVDCLVDNEGFLTPRHIVLEPDYLVDASSIAECFHDYLTSPLLYFLNKFEEIENRSYLLLGNLANFFLDELVFANHPEEVSFKESFLRSFRQSPFEYTSCEDILKEADFREFMEKARKQFENIRRVIRDDFPKQGINLHHCTLEPSFFCERFGFQGRLDLLQPPSDGEAPRIVELKSGRLPFPANNTKRIALNHEVQTAIYRLMIETVFGRAAEPMRSFILYSASGQPGENLRAATHNEELEKNILTIRNLIVSNELLLAFGDNDEVSGLFSSLFNLPQSERRLPSFLISKLSRMQKALERCGELERTYFYRFIRFVSRELYHQKVGLASGEMTQGFASLWNSSFAERAEALELLHGLTIETIDMEGNDMTILFKRNETENRIVNFRNGDICIVYPRETNDDTVLSRQIMKGTISKISNKSVEIRFRHKQKNHRIFEENRFWAIEHDTLDTTFNAMYKGLYAFMKADERKRALLLGLIPPGGGGRESGMNPDIENLNDMESLAERTVRQALEADDYFLIVGPPGTGKTSIAARRLIEEFHKRPDTNLMVLAYTNRAVDELCEAINAAFDCHRGECDAYIRVGSELTCDAPYRHRLLQRIAEKAPDRTSLMDEIIRTRIYVSTLASINGRKELFSLKHFHVAIIDEASQILEPQIIGLLPRFDKFILIGDHYQLSTIVLQEKPASLIDEPLLLESGFRDCRDSFFERLLRLCQKNGWQHAYARLSQQGRMHRDIALFPANRFYDGKLTTAKKWQTEAWQLRSPSAKPFDQWIASGRTLFISTERIAVPTSPDKMNDIEAKIIVKLSQSLQAVYACNGIDFNPAAIGIITPYRNQIALIKDHLSVSGIDGWENILVDTVERYQGSQREVILISFCANRPEQMNFLSDPNENGRVDRKLNVAVTRARRQLLLTGNAPILSESPAYAAMIEHYRDQHRLIVIEKIEK